MRVTSVQSYLAKFPAKRLEALPELKQPVAALLRNDGAGPPNGEVEEAVSQFEVVAGRRRRKSLSQGRQTDPALRAAVEAHAMNLALEHYEELGVVVDTSLTESYDYAVDIEGVEWHIEVKGTTTPGEQVLLTPNEVKHGLTFPNVALFVVSDIRIENHEGGPVAVGGSVQIHHPWSLDTESLSATGYTYVVPAGGFPVGG